jgi:16S rRNA (guanine(966)-N(2))-methyltransferase RsmD
LKSLPGLHLRPTPDRLRETLFDILAPRIEGVVFLDAYAGSGAVGIEALSRGAERAIFIEKHHAAVEVIRDNLKSLAVEERAQVICGKTLVALPRMNAGIVFLDPPYDQEIEYDSALRAMASAPPPLAIAQHPARLRLKDEYGRLQRVRQVKQGDNILSFFEPADLPLTVSSEGGTDSGPGG